MFGGDLPYGAEALANASPWESSWSQIVDVYVVFVRVSLFLSSTAVNEDLSYIYSSYPRCIVV